MPTLSVESLLRASSLRLQAITDRPRLEAELLLSHVLGCPRIALWTAPEAPVTAAQVQAFRDLLERRAAGEPLPYLTGRREFYGLSFIVTPAVLIPRPETESLVELALAWLEGHPAALVADIGTGSGCIAVTVARLAAQTRVYAVDISADALAVARRNAAQHHVAERITFLEGDLLAPLPEPVDLLIGNPPYVAESAWDTLPPSVRREPREALLAGPRGLSLLRRLLQQAPAALRPGGAVLLELGETQGKAVARLARDSFPAAEVRLRRDLAGKVRFLSVQLP